MRPSKTSQRKETLDDAQESRAVLHLLLFSILRIALGLEVAF